MLVLGEVEETNDNSLMQDELKSRIRVKAFEDNSKHILSPNIQIKEHQTVKKHYPIREQAIKK